MLKHFIEPDEENGRITKKESNEADKKPLWELSGVKPNTQCLKKIST